MEKENYSRLNKKSLRTFCISFSIGMLLIAIFSILRQVLNRNHLQINFIPAIITGSLFCYHQIVLWVLPNQPSLKRPHFAVLAILLFYTANSIWKIVALIIGTVVFGVIFYLIFMPVSLFVKFYKKDHIKNKITGWQKVPGKINIPEQCRKLF